MQPSNSDCHFVHFGLLVHPIRMLGVIRRLVSYLALRLRSAVDLAMERIQREDARVCENSLRP